MANKYHIAETRGYNNALNHITDCPYKDEMLQSFWTKGFHRGWDERTRLAKLNQKELPDWAKDNIKNLIMASFAPYKAFDEKPTEDELKTQLEEYRKKLEAAGFGPPSQQISDIFEQLTDDLEDDFHNCGGLMLHRIPDCQMIWKLLNEEQQTKLVDLLSEQLIGEIEDIQTIKF